MKLARAALGAVLIALGAPAVAQEPETPFVSLGDIQRARSTYIIQLSTDVPASRLPARAQALTAKAGGTLRHTYTNVLHGFAATMSSVALAKLLEDNDDIVSVQRDSVDVAFAKPNCDTTPTHPSCGGGSGGGESIAITACEVSTQDTEYPWGVAHVNADGAHTMNPAKCAAGVDIYILDTGVDLDHSDLDVKDAWDCTKPNCAEGGDDKNGHGTHVAGTAAAVVNGAGVAGVAPQAGLYSVKVLGNSGIGFRSDIQAGIDFVAGRVRGGDPAVINMSIGGTLTGDGSCAGGSWNGGSDLYYKTICEAANHGVIFVVAAGNEGQDTAKVAPAGYDEAVITVSAVNSDNDWPSWSNWGGEVDIAAPGVSVDSARKGGGVTTMSGTSMASPHVAGAAALWLAAQTTKPTGYSAFSSFRTAVTDPNNSIAIGPSGNHDEPLLNAGALAQ